MRARLGSVSARLKDCTERCASAVPAATAEQLRAIAAEFERGAEALALAGSRRRFTHPFFGGLDVVTGVRFMTIHTRHHLVNLPDARRAGPPRSSH